MNRPIEAGCLAEVISGATGNQSPNIGLVVKVLSFAGDHSLHGRMWLCEAEYAELAQPGSNVKGGHAHFAQSWLKRIDPPPKTDTTTTKKEITA